MTALRERLIAGLSKIPYSFLNGEREKRLPGNVSFCFEGIEGDEAGVWIIHDENGNYQGYDIELANRLGQDLGVDVELVSTEAANRVEYLQTGKVDVILANFTVTPERAEAVDFADPS